ncbi:glycerophosphodiester phosphodiesterase family protein [Streptomyces sp. DSM 44917]|uniref:Glycerophosphodiester phosphodiesterase family protein n=1 Tax=Streptomyces boetiae TaxID=3075541 RepID=A0ABU2L4R6_9ACTN|nr:glycerophosphodiester phosphodiesterase family protein [Streptomyces sp. DSM 44917]MDT0306507.1 glycerophosphodiester phosphodiesterase family protein [Streptomyces sp. DSM 44917]
MRVRRRGWGIPVAAAVSAVVTVVVGNAVPGAEERVGREGRDVPVVAHRGASREGPEETVTAYREALAQGAEVLEGDVQLTADGELILLHDDTLERTTDVEEVFPERASANVGEFTLAEIRRLDAGSWHRPEFAGQRVPTVEEVLRLSRGRAGLSLELKEPGNSPGVATRLAALLEEYGYDGDDRTRDGAWKIMVHSRDQGALREFARELPEVPIAYLTGGAMPADAELAALAEWTVGVFADPRLTSATDVDRAHEAGLVAYSDPVDSPEQLDMALDQGYDHLVTNVPELAARVRDGRNPEPRAAGVVVDHVVPNPSGDDMQPERSEYIALRNTTRRPLDVGGHYLRDGAGNVRVFIGEGYVIPPGSLLRVHLGPGTNSPTDYHNGYSTAILNNTVGDTVLYYNERHEIEDVHSYLAPPR